MQKAILPSECPEGTPLSHFIGDPDYCLTYTVEDLQITTRVKKLTTEDRQFIASANAKILALTKTGHQHDDLFWIETALSLLEFVDEHSEIIKQHFTIAADFISCIMMCLYKLSDEVKNRNLDIIPDSGWKLFDLLAKLVHQKDTTVTPYFEAEVSDLCKL